MTAVDRQRPWLVGLTAIWLAGLLVSGWQPFDRATWWLEIAPALVILPLLWAWHRQLPLTSLALALVTLHGLVLMLGGAYTYARVPAGFVVQDWLGLARNPYDRLGHFMQGFVPVIVIRELLIRAGGIGRGRLLAFLVVAICLAISATYELIEFGAAMAMGQGADEFLGTQGDPWDTQWDMLTCLVGSSVAVALLGRWHDRQIAAVAAPPIGT
jgi:putative membrane protein